MLRVILGRYEGAPKEAAGGQAQDRPAKDNPIGEVAGYGLQGSPPEKINLDVNEAGGLQGCRPALAVVGPDHLDFGIHLRLKDTPGRNLTGGQGKEQKYQGTELFKPESPDQMPPP